MALARRRFFELADTSSHVAPGLDLISTLYLVEKIGRLNEMEPDDLLALRQKFSVPTMTRLKQWVPASVKDEPPDTAFANALACFVNHWQARDRFTQDGRLDIDYNEVERSIRCLAPCRHVGLSRHRQRVSARRGIKSETYGNVRHLSYEPRRFQLFLHFTYATSDDHPARAAGGLPRHPPNRCVLRAVRRR